MLETVVHPTVMNDPRPARAEESDGELLVRFVTGKDAVAFAGLVGRHGAMVMGVCRRVLQNGHDAEDAFQATFLVLFHKAASVRPAARVGNWLYGVAFRTATKAKSLRHKMQTRETHLEESLDTPAKGAERNWKDMEAVLDQELTRLPDKYRIPLVMCDLQGVSGKDAAARLGWPEGTVSGRLTRGREILRQRMTRYVATITSLSLAGLFARQASAAVVPEALLKSTISGATLLASGQAVTSGGAFSLNVTALSKGVLKSMFIAKVKIAAIVLLSLGATVAVADGINRGFMQVPQPVRLTDGPAASGDGQQMSPEERQAAERAAKERQAKEAEAKKAEADRAAAEARARDAAAAQAQGR